MIQKKFKSKYGITVSRTAIYKLINKFKKNDRLTNMPKTGRLPILNKHELNFLCDLIKHNREITPKTLKKDILLKYNKICYESTIRNSAKKMLWTKNLSKLFYFKLIFERLNIFTYFIFACIVK